MISGLSHISHFGSLCWPLELLGRPGAGVASGRLLDVKVHGAKHGDPIALSGWICSLLGLFGRYLAVLVVSFSVVIGPETRQT